MSILTKIKTGRTPRAQKVVIYAPEGFGKSTLASKFPVPVFLDLEGGTSQLDIEARVSEEDLPDLASVEKAVKEIIKAGKWKTLVVDTVDWMEQMAIADICKAADVSSVEDFGYGKGYVKLHERMLLTLAVFDQAIHAGMNVVLLAHVSVVRFDPPDGAGAYDRYELKLSKDRKSGKGTASLLKEWADMQLFGNWRVQIVEKGKGDAKTFKGVGGRDRKLYCSRCSAWDAKNRHGLADEEPWDIETIKKAFSTVGAPWDGNAAAGAATSTAADPKPADKVSPAVCEVSAGDKKEGPARDQAQPAPPDLRAVEDPIPGIEAEENPDAELTKLLGAAGELVNRYLRDKGRIAPDQSFLSVAPDYRVRILKNPAGFMDIVRAHCGVKKEAA